MAHRNTEPAILIIEDDADIAVLLRELLREEGYRAETMPDGRALDGVVAAPPALILLDLMLPQVDGGEICRRLRADPRTRAVPIVVMTAAPPATIYERLRGCDCQRVLPKPFDIDEVLALASRYASPRAAWPAGGDGAHEATAC